MREVWVEKNQSRLRDKAMIQDHVDALKLKQSNLLDRLATSTSAIVQAKLETEIEEVEEAITEASNQSPDETLTETQIDELFVNAKHRLEHPVEYALSASTKVNIEKVWSTIFRVPPTYDDLKSGTPELTLLYRLNRDFAGDKRQMAAHLSENWNSFVAVQLKSKP